MTTYFRLLLFAFHLLFLRAPANEFSFRSYRKAFFFFAFHLQELSNSKTLRAFVGKGRSPEVANKITKNNMHEGKPMKRTDFQYFSLKFTPERMIEKEIKD